MLRRPCQRNVKSDPPKAVFGTSRAAHTRREEGNRKRREFFESATPGRLGARSCQQRHQRCGWSGMRNREYSLWRRKCLDRGFREATGIYILIFIINRIIIHIFVLTYDRITT